MALNARDVKKLRRIIHLAQKLIDEDAKARRSLPKSKARLKGNRRTGKELTAFRAHLRAERKKGTPVAELAKKNGVSPTYIYLLG